MSDELIDPHHARRDLRMLAAAIKRGWAIPENLRDRLPEAMAEIALNEAADKNGKRSRKRYDARSRIAAARVLVQMDRANVAAESAAKQPLGDEESRDLHLHLHKHEAGQNEVPAIEVVHVDDWYGTPVEENDTDNTQPAAQDPAAAQPTTPDPGSD